ncbi:MAG: VOC family protein [Alphaproteobacteria bacterium]|nr:VOC family protein [Alphaproteobacteria bacterium]MCW5741478.1 VOC family protein [Alphaproteobacteria bacterium]
MSGTGRFVWYELMTTDTKAAKAFYGKVVGYGTQDMPEMHYAVFTIDGGRGVRGLMEMPEELRKGNVPPHWLGYVGVDDVDAGTEKARSLGATIQVPPQDIPTVGRFSMFLDPGGAALALFKPLPMPGGDPGPVAPGTVGGTGWNELYAADGAKAFDFYSALFGWKKFDTMDMGPMGLYHLFGPPDADMPMGGMMTKPTEVPVPFWTYYMQVGPIEAATQRVRDAGGQVLMGPMEVPGGDWIIQGMDPQGAAFALVGQKG